jgi:Uma2 family endonuclease
VNAIRCFDILNAECWEDDTCGGTPIVAVAPKHLSLDEFLRLPEEEPALEFEDGEVTQKVPPSGEHGALQTGLAILLGVALQAHKTARVFTETRVTFGGASRVPDICIYRWDRVPVDEAGNVARDFRVPPDITIEIVSPEQSVNALV